jgi:hypothetical protein
MIDELVGRATASLDDARLAGDAPQALAELAAFVGWREH